MEKYSNEDMDLNKEIDNISGEEFLYIRNFAGLKAKDVINITKFNTPQTVYNWERAEKVRSWQALVLLKLMDIKIWRAARQKWNSTEDKRILICEVKGQKTPLPPGRYRVAKKKKKKVHID